MNGIARTHLACACIGLPVATARGRVEWVAERGFRAVQLDARAVGMRPRELERSGRRDVAALLRRMELTLAGVDLLIPSHHFVEPETADRAVGAAVAALEFASEIASLAGGDAALTLTLPEQSADEAAKALAAAAERSGARLAELRWPMRDFTGPFASPVWGVAFDPASALLEGDDPAMVVGRCANRLAAARLSDVSRTSRAAPGQGRLEIGAYRAALEASGFRGSATLDLEGVEDPERAATIALDAWTAL